MAQSKGHVLLNSLVQEDAVTPALQLIPLIAYAFEKLSLGWAYCLEDSIGKRFFQASLQNESSDSMWMEISFELAKQGTHPTAISWHEVAAGGYIYLSQYGSLDANNNLSFPSLNPPAAGQRGILRARIQPSNPVFSAMVDQKNRIIASVKTIGITRTAQNQSPLPVYESVEVQFNYMSTIDNGWGLANTSVLDAWAGVVSSQNTVIVGQPDGIKLSTNDGQYYTLLKSTAGGCNRIEHFNGIFTLSVADEGVYAFFDGGLTSPVYWIHYSTTSAAPILNNSPTGIFMYKSGGTYILGIVGPNGGSFYAGSPNWLQIPAFVNFTTDQGLPTNDLKDIAIYYNGSEDIKIFVATSLGMSFSTVATVDSWVNLDFEALGFPVDNLPTTATAVSCHQDGIAIIVGTDKGFAISLDSGATWTAVQETFCSLDGTEGSGENFLIDLYINRIRVSYDFTYFVIACGNTGAGGITCVRVSDGAIYSYRATRQFNIEVDFEVNASMQLNCNYKANLIEVNQ